jgi:transposase-like protein
MSEEPINFHRILRDLIKKSTNLPALALNTKLLPDIGSLKCNSCSSPIRFSQKGYKCTQSYCSNSFSPFYGTPFRGTDKEKRKQLILFACFCEGVKVSEAAHTAGVSEHTTTKWFQEFRKKFEEIHHEEMADEPLGPDCEVDESQFGHRKYNVGRVIPGQWVFGICESQVGGRVHMVPVANRSAAVLMPIIASHTKPNSTITSDLWTGTFK